MKSSKILGMFLLVVFSACSSIRTTIDYDTEVDFTKYKTFAFSKKAMDKADASDLDKKRLMRAIEAELSLKGMTKSNNPDLLVSLFTKSKEVVNVNQMPWGWGWGWGFGWGWNPWWGGGMNNVNINQLTQGTLYIDLIDRETDQLVWQGIGRGALRIQDMKKKEERIRLFVKEIIARYPPKKSQ